jgi:hypothetical protein
MNLFIHLYFLTEFEILFYIFYIMPLEKELILGLLEFDDAPSYTNIALINITLNLSKCPEYQSRLDHTNHKLWNMCVYYLIAINSILVLLFCRDLFSNYVKYGENVASSPKCNAGSSLMAFGSANNLSEQKKNDDRGIEMVSFVKRGTEEPRETWFVIYYWKKSVFVAEMCKIVQFIILVAVFEYLFFKLVVNKYKILDKKTLLCNLAKK